MDGENCPAAVDYQVVAPWKSHTVSEKQARELDPRGSRLGVDKSVFVPSQHWVLWDFVDYRGLNVAEKTNIESHKVNTRTDERLLSVPGGMQRLVSFRSRCSPDQERSDNGNQGYESNEHGDPDLSCPPRPLVPFHPLVVLSQDWA